MKSDDNGATLFDRTEPKINQTYFPSEDWSPTTCGPCKADSPSNEPSPRGIVFTVKDFVGSSHASDSVDRL